MSYGLNYFVETEGAVWDVLSALLEDGDGGVYRGEPYAENELPKVELSEQTGFNFRDGKYRTVLEQLVRTGVVNCRLAGPNNHVGFYSLPVGMTRDEFFTRKAAARLAWKVEAESDPVLNQALLAKLDRMALPVAYTELTKAVTTKHGATAARKWWRAYRRQSNRLEVQSVAR